MAIPAEFSSDSGAVPVALVTGGAKRVGAALVRALATDGFQVALHYHHSATEAAVLAKEIADAGQLPPILIRADLAQKQAAGQIFAALPQAPQILINNASVFEEDRLGALDADLFDRQMAVNVRAPALLSDRFFQQLPAATKGLIINLSDAKLAAPNPDFLSYSLSKFALMGLTEMTARAMAPSVRVNAIAPSVTLVSGPQSRANFEKAHVYNALKRGVVVADLVRALRFFVETPSITGQTITLDGGQRFLALGRDVAYMVEP